MKRLKINKISKRHYEGEVYNLELESTSEKDDLFWIEQRTGIVTHNCFPKDVAAIVAASEKCGYNPVLIREILLSNDRIGRLRAQDQP
jgi:UDPglucose 6-dehydrogenase